jgi:hypothetical protein
MNTVRLGLIALAGFVSVSMAELSAAERAAGWRMLFDGGSWAGWRSYGKDAPPARGWEIEDGSLRVIAGGGGGDIVTEEEFGDFELCLEFKVSPNANSGIMYRVAETRDYPWQTGPEYQVLDDARDEAKNRLHSVGAVYDLYLPADDKPVRPAGAWNEARIRIRDGVAQHFLNGAKVAEYDMKSPEWAARIAGSKFAGYEGFGVQPRGRIALQDHGDDVWYRNIRVRDLDGENGAAVFNGRDLSGWGHFLTGEADPSMTWSVEDGAIVCTGSPNGYLKTEGVYRDFVLRFQWRWSPVTKRAGNSGVLLRTVGEDKCWPDCVEAQLMSGNAGDFVNLSGAAMEMPRAEGRFGRKSHGAERPIGEWNEYEIVCEGDRIALFVNGEKVNEASGCPERAGVIGLQSEGAEIHFRAIEVRSIE